LHLEERRFESFPESERPALWLSHRPVIWRYPRIGDSTPSTGVLQRNKNLADSCRTCYRQPLLRNFPYPCPPKLYASPGLGYRTTGRSHSCLVNWIFQNMHLWVIFLIRMGKRCDGAGHPRGDFLRTRNSRLRLAICAGYLLGHLDRFTFNRTLLPT
jgi:hypothetical protein